MVEARKKEVGGWRSKKGRDFVFIRVWGESWRGGGRKRVEIKLILLSFFPFALPPGLNSNAKERCQGAAFLSFLSLASSGLGFSVGAPHLVGIRLQKESRVGCVAVGVET